MPLIDSPRNARVVAAAALRDRSERAARQATIVDGGRECRRALEAGATVEAAFVCPALVHAGDARWVIERLGAMHVEFVEVSERVHDRLAFGNRGDGVVLVVRTGPLGIERLRVGPDPLLIVTEDVEKPGNIGAILRTADAAGCDAVIAVGGTDLFNPNVIRASVGTVFGVALATATAPDAREWLAAHAIRIVAARVDAPAEYTSIDLTGAVAIVLGGEASGLSAAWTGPGIDAVRLRMRGRADSLNVAVTGAILAFEARRQRDLAVQPARSVP